jgi:hypothetical protein
MTISKIRLTSLPISDTICHFSVPGMTFSRRIAVLRHFSSSDKEPSWDLA